jgi:hypothetical protein
MQTTEAKWMLRSEYDERLEAAVLEQAHTLTYADVC